MVSPLTNDGETVSVASEAILPDDFDENYYVWPLTYPFSEKDETSDTKSVASLEAMTLSTLPSRSKPLSLQVLTTTKNIRQTSQSAHQERQLIAEGQTIRSSVYKSATVMWESVVRSDNTLKVFETSHKTADAFNRLCGIEMISGNELEAAITNGDVGKSPPRRGRLQHGSR